MFGLPYCSLAIFFFFFKMLNLEGFKKRLDLFTGEEGHAVAVAGCPLVIGAEKVAGKTAVFP